MTRVLIVDDEPSICQIVSMALRLAGYAVETASDGRMALQSLLKHPADVVISDVRMPHMTGPALLQAIRANPALAQVRFVILAGLSDADPATRQALSQADAHLAKPFTREQLLASLRSIGL